MDGPLSEYRNTVQKGLSRRRAEDGGGSEPGRSIERCSPGNLHKKTPLLLECKKQSFDFMINSAFKTNKPHFFE
jgi:hypothetical protein